MKAIFLDEPDLEFYGARHIDIRFGIANYGPLDQELPSAPKAIRVGIVGTPQSVEGVRSWFDKCREPIAAKTSKQPNLFPAFPGSMSKRRFAVRSSSTIVSVGTFRGRR